MPSKGWRRWTSSWIRRPRRPDLQDARGAQRLRDPAEGRARRRSGGHGHVPCAAARALTIRFRSRRIGGCARPEIALDEVYRHLDTHVLFKLHWGGRGSRRRLGEAAARRLPAAARAACGAIRIPATAGAAGLLPCNSDGNDLIVWDPEDFDPAHPRELERLVFPRQPRHDRICCRFLPSPRLGHPTWWPYSGDRGQDVTELMASLEADGEFAEQLFVHGLGVQTAEGMRSGCTHGCAATSASPRAGRGTPGVTLLPRAVRAHQGIPVARRARDRTAPSPRDTPSSPSSPRWRSSPTIRRRSTSGCGRERCPGTSGRPATS